MPRRVCGSGVCCFIPNKLWKWPLFFSLLFATTAYWITLETQNPVWIQGHLTGHMTGEEQVNTGAAVMDAQKRDIAVPRSNIAPRVETLESDDTIQFRVTSNLTSVCPHMRRPDPKLLTKFRGVYHYFMAPDNNSLHSYFLNTYYDDRLARSEDISVKTVGSANFDLTVREIYAAFWYPGLTKSVVVKCEVSLGPGPMGNNAVHYGYKRYTFTCSLPYQHFYIPPEYVSLSVGKCAAPITNYIPVVIPAPRNPGGPSRIIGNCMQSLYGNFTDEFALMFVNWMETITMYGISEVTVNLNMFTNNPLGEKVFRYYQDKGTLTVTEYPDIIPEDTHLREQTVGRIQSFIQLPFVDCFFKNMHRYWYFAPLDVDELFVINPKYKTYQDYLATVLARDPNLRNSIFFTSKVAGYYSHYKPANLTVPEHLPLFRYIKRDKLVGVGHKKSFQNPQTCIFAGVHSCRPLKQEDQSCEQCGYRAVTLPSEEIVLNHYRHSCKRNTGCLSPEEAILDEGVLSGYTGSVMRQRVEMTLKRIGYLT